MDLDQLFLKNTDKTKAIIPVHLYGQTVEMDKLNEIIRGSSIKIIED